MDFATFLQQIPQDLVKWFQDNYNDLYKQWLYQGNGMGFTRWLKGYIGGSNG